MNPRKRYGWQGPATIADFWNWNGANFTPKEAPQ